ncbi:MAG: cell division protein FtsZ [Bacteroidota bacterium]
MGNLNLEKKSIILGIGVGGGGSNVLKYIFERGIPDVSLVVANTDSQALEHNPVPDKLQLGPNITHGLGAGAKPEIGESAALESKEEIKKLLDDPVKMVFITAGMGGGTGTGAAPVIASIAKDKGLLVIGVVTTPFLFEGTKKQNIAEEGIRNLAKYCDTLIIIENERLIKQEAEFKATQQFTLSSAFGLADVVLYEAITSITDPISSPGIINLDYRDMDTTLRNAGNAVMGSGVAEGKDRGLTAAKRALSSPLLRYQTIQGATRLLLTIFSSPEAEIKVPELSSITAYIRAQVGMDVEMMIWGHAYDKDLGDKIRVNIIASGFSEKKKSTKVASKSSTEKQASFFDKVQTSYSHSSLPTEPALLRKGPSVPTSSKPNQQKIRFFKDRTDHILNSLRDGEDYHLTDKEIQDRLLVPAYVRARILLDYTALTEQEPTIYYLYPEHDQEVD